ncbi:hypothetical protein MA16_Dca028778 [Dendrobium catenatum]|uniref:Uncharacterized protein n=1 Tax=Dendrobium catenatum TaxID=906689 RepID=A0A2I0VAS5_9ASPA|nr:hypothetical protein MA16_Dca028778 [Dendrobium catenatum]
MTQTLAAEADPDLGGGNYKQCRPDAYDVTTDDDDETERDELTTTNPKANDVMTDDVVVGRDLDIECNDKPRVCIDDRRLHGNECE